MLRIKHRVCGSALPAALLLIGIGAMGMTGAAAQGTPEARQACTPDAMRLCSEFVSERVANDKVHDGRAGTMESGMPRRDGAQGLPPRLSALRILHGRCRY